MVGQSKRPASSCEDFANSSIAKNMNEPNDSQKLVKFKEKR